MLNNPLGQNALLSEVLRYAPEYAIQNLMSEILEKVELAEGIENLGFGSPGDVEKALNGAHERIQELKYELREETDRLYSTIESLENELADLRCGKGE